MPGFGTLLDVARRNNSRGGEVAGAGFLVDAFEDQLPGPDHDVDNPEDGCDGDHSLREVDDTLLGDAGAEVVDPHEVLDFIHGRGVGVDGPGFEDVRHVGLGLDEPGYRLEEIILGKDQPGRFVDGRDHGELVDMNLAPSDVVG